MNSYGPFDYRVDKAKLKVVEDYHFAPRVESLVSGQSGSIGADLALTLRASPNHHRALMALMKLSIKLKTPEPPGADYSVECYFARALQFRPDDTVARMIYAKYLTTNGRKGEAISQVVQAAEISRDNGFSQYNAGLVFFEMGEFDKALVQAHKAMSLGFERLELKQQLVNAGKWADPLPEKKPSEDSTSESRAARSGQQAASEPSR